ncbi:MAG: PAS domain S-box protein [Piscinibacter sp.]|uniref:ATP-binding protein n=1 Tax=Piscinibacter TaxID=1114981 RepID=UPI00197C83C2|nr:MULTISPECIES: ATP-binding protein [Piscinibacter]MCW5667201.1 PAS domain S-box protein [Piscinibacter sp.]
MQRTAFASLALSRWVQLAGVALAMTVMAVAGFELRHERQREVDEARARQALHARVLEDQVTRSIESTRLALSAVATALAAGEPRAPGASGFAVELATLPQLRALAVLDAQGRVLDSSAPREVGQRIDPARLGPWPAPGRDRLGAYLGVRSIGDLAEGAAAVPSGIGSVPLLLGASGRDGRPLLVLALLHADGWGSHMRVAIDEPATLGMLLSFDGQVLASTDARLAEPGRPTSAHTAWRERLVRRDHDDGVGAGLGGADQVFAYRAARRLPLVVVVERARHDVIAGRRAEEFGLLGGAGVVALFVLLASTVAARSLRGREAARAQVVRSERELSLIVGSVQELLFRTDAQGRLTFVNARWNGAAEPLGRTLASLALPGDAAALQQLFADDGGQAPRSVQARLRDAQGTPGGRRYGISVTPLREPGGVLAGFAGSAVDVTERWVAQQRLQAQLDFTELLLEIVPIPIALLDAQGSYLTVNRAWEQFSGRRRAEVLGRAARDFQTAEDAERHQAVDRELLALGGSRRYEAGFLRHDGSRADLLVSKIAVPGEDGRPNRILSAFMDVSELRRAERAVGEARDAAEEASRAKSEFIANISHELRTPLQSIIGFSELGMVRGRAHEKLAAMFTDIHASGQRMLALVNDLLDVAKIESTVGTFHLERTDLRALLREVVRELDPLLAPRQLRIQAQLAEQPLVAKVDPLRFQQAVRNILANAIKFCASGHAIDLLAEATPEGEAHIAVRDRGPGIPEAELESIFEAFVQSSQTKDGSGGTGLGLAICRKIVAAHGGRIRAENAAGGGSVFHIHLPLRGFADTQPADMV